MSNVNSAPVFVRDTNLTFHGAILT